MGNTYFEHKTLHKTQGGQGVKGARGQDGLKVKSIIDLMLEKKEMLGFVQ